MRQPSNVRCYLPKSEAARLLTVFEQIEQGMRGNKPDTPQQNERSQCRSPDPSREGSDYNATDDFAKSLDEAYRVIRERMASGGPGWTPK